MLEHLETSLQKRREETGLIYTIGKPADESSIRGVEFSLNLSFPEQVRQFYNRHNGLAVQKPALNIWPLEEFARGANERVRFATFDNDQHVSFAVTRLNDDGQWDIVNDLSGELITLTMASFWSNKIWHWIDKRRRVWLNEVV